MGYLTAAALARLLEGTSDEPINVVNAHLLAAERQILVRQDRFDEDQAYTNLLELRLIGQNQVTVAGALLDRDRPRIVNIDGYEMDLPPDGVAFLIWRQGPSRPGFVGQVGTLLGASGASISAIQVSQEALDEVGLMALILDDDIPEAVVDQVQAENGVLRTLVLRFVGGAEG
jgi:D-3-phosphoglycerate dehydrogenase